MHKISDRNICMWFFFLVLKKVYFWHICSADSKFHAYFLVVLCLSFVLVAVVIFFFLVVMMMGS